MEPGQKVREPLFKEPGHTKRTVTDSVWRVESSFFGHKTPKKNSKWELRVIERDWDAWMLNRGVTFILLRRGKRMSNEKGLAMIEELRGSAEWK